MSNTLNLGTDGNWATKEDSLLAYNSENGNFKPLAFNFTRASSATVVNKDGLIETVGGGEPRIDFSNDAKGALLLEPTRSNIIAYSEDFSNAYWTKSGSSVTSGFTSPSGDTNAFKLVEDTSTVVHRLEKLFTGLSASTDYYSLSVRVKKEEIGALILGLRTVAFANRAEATFDLTNGVISVPADDSFGNLTNASAQIELMADGYYNISLSVQKNTDTDLIAYIYLAENITDTIATATYTGDGTSGVYIYGAQLEQGSYATSYIPNFGNSAGATRVADVCNNGGNEQVINSTEGVLYAEISALANDGTNRTIGILGDSSNLIELAYRNTTNQLRVLIKSSNVFVVNFQHTLSDITSYNKIALKYKNNDCSLWINGLKVLTDTSANMPSGLSELNFNRFDGAEDFYGNVKDLRLYNTALTDSELTALTKI